MGEAPFDVIVLEDDDLLRDVLTDIVEAQGFLVRPASHAAEAIGYLNGGPGCRLLLTDIGLGGGPDGFEAAQEAQAALPGLAVIYLTGRPAHAEGRVFGPRERFLRKPFRTRELVEAMAQLGVMPPLPL